MQQLSCDAMDSKAMAAFVANEIPLFMNQSPPHMSRPSVIIKLILGLLWFIVHLAISLFSLWFDLIYSIECYLISFGLIPKYQKFQLDRLKHLAVVVDSSEAKNVAKINQLLCWLSNVGVKYVCLYDIDGVLKKTFAPAMNGSRYGNSGKYLDGIAKAASLLCSTYVNGNRNTCGIGEIVFTEADMSGALKAIGCGGPEPDLLLVYGPARCHLGFPAWRLRYTEIMHMGPLNSMKYGAIVKAFYKFSKKYQNFDLKSISHRYPRPRRAAAAAAMSQPTQCPYCRASGPARCVTTQPPLSRAVSECSSCARLVLERHLHTHPFFPLLPSLHPLPLVTPDLADAAPSPSPSAASASGDDDDDDPFLPAGFVSAFSAFSLERHPVLARSASAFSGQLAELERALAVESAASSTPDPAGPMVSVDSLRAYLQIVDVASILRLDRDIADHAFELFKDCSSATCLRNRSVEALATAALVQAIREAQEPRTLQEISTASNLPQKEIGKYIKILGESLKLSQPLNSNSIAVHMPRFCSLLQLNKSAQELAAHIGEVVVNKCFCTRRNPISISAAAIYLACQLEDKRKTQAEICKVTGLTEVTLRKVYKELLENWDDLLPPNYTPATPPEKAFPMTTIYSSRSSSGKDLYQDKQLDSAKLKSSEAAEPDHMVIVKEEEDKKIGPFSRPSAKTETHDLNQAIWTPNVSSTPFTSSPKLDHDKTETSVRGINLNEASCTVDTDRPDMPVKSPFAERWLNESKVIPSPSRQPAPWQLKQGAPSAGSSYHSMPYGLDLLSRGKRSTGDGGDKEGR
uniref:ditrans,polycis-polyprenyl diphosphate synthase [(2E,6E)-farnesyldiphosphate specific] n=1 Tax=Oryza meridionalis TaxID=40149 RepID=A0A0E0CWN1_9ORYZ